MTLKIERFESEINHFNAEVLTSGRMIPSAINNPLVVVYTSKLVRRIRFSNNFYQVSSGIGNDKTQHMIDRQPRKVSRYQMGNQKLKIEKGQIIQWTKGLIQWTKGQIIQWTKGQIIQWTKGQIIQWTKGQIIQWTKGLIQWTKGQIIQWTKGQIMIFKTLHIKLKIEQQEPH